MNYQLPSDYPIHIKKLRGKHGLTQTNLGKLLGVSLDTIRQWENGTAKPTFRAWQLILYAEAMGVESIDPDLASWEHGVKENTEPYGKGGREVIIPLDFSANPEIVRLVAEGERLGLGHLSNQSFVHASGLGQPSPGRHAGENHPAAKVLLGPRIARTGFGLGSHRASARSL